jgi:hypothetical protein
MIKTLFGFVLIALIFLSTLGVTVYRSQNPEFLNKQAREANLYGRLTTNLPQVLPDEFGAESGLGKEDVADVLVAVVDGQTFYSFLDSATTSYLSYLTGRSSELNFRYDLTPLKTTGRDRALDRLLAKYEELPVCDNLQARTWTTEHGLPSCKLPAGNVRENDVSRLLGQFLDETFEPMPDELIAEESPKLQRAREQVSGAISLIKLIWVITLAVLLLYLIIYRQRGFLSLAFIFLLTGLVSAAFSLIAWDWVGKLVTELLPEKTNALVPLFIDLVTAVLDVLKRTLSAFAVALVLVGALFLLLWIFYRPRSRHTSVVTPPQ